jgi:rSAM/selenodomain-associated transferase 1
VRLDPFNAHRDSPAGTNSVAPVGASWRVMTRAPDQATRPPTDARSVDGSGYHERMRATRGPILVLFARPPRLGGAKSRLAAALGEETALALYTAFLRDSIDLLRRVSPRGIRPAIAWSDPLPPGSGPAPPGLDEDLAGFERMVQRGDDLGQRMADCLATLLSAGHDRVAIIGADTPTLPIDILYQAFELLRDRDLVIGPARDGGYYLLGARSVVPEIFKDIPWGTDRVLSQTLWVLKTFGMPRVLLPEWDDIDTVESLEILRSALEAAPADSPVGRHTRQALRALPRPPAVPPAGPTC